MIRYVYLAVVAAACMTGTLVDGQQSEVPGAVPGEKVRALKPVQEAASDPRLDMVGKFPMRVEVLPLGAMKDEDKDLASGAMAEVRRRAAFHDLGYPEGDWQQSQIECPAFPQHLLLRFTRTRGAGDVSMFAASIPRGKAGRVRVIPILRRGYALISPAPMSKVTIAAFNEMRAEEQMGEKADWPALSLCYAAFSSMRWEQPKSEMTLTPLGADTIQLVENGAVNVAIELDAPAAGRWVVSYDRKGQLEKTEYVAFGSEVWRPLPAIATEMRGKPLPSGPVEAGKPLPSGNEPTGKALPAGNDPTGRSIPATAPAESPNKPD